MYPYDGYMNKTNILIAAALMTLSACATEVAGSAELPPAPEQPAPMPEPTVPDPAAPWYAGATEAHPVCRIQSAQSQLKTGAAFCVGMLASDKGADCRHIEETNQSVCRDGREVQWESDGDGYAFQGDDFLARITPGEQTGAYNVRFENGVTGTCAVVADYITFCVTGAECQ